MNKPLMIENFMVIGARAMIAFNDDPKRVQRSRYFSFGKRDPATDADQYGVPDRLIFQYVEGIDEMKRLQHGSDDEFTVLYYNLELRELEDESSPASVATV